MGASEILNRNIVKDPDCSLRYQLVLVAYQL